MFCMRWVIDLQETGNQDILWESGTCEEDSEHFSTCVSTVQQNMINTFGIHASCATCLLGAIQIPGVDECYTRSS